MDCCYQPAAGDEHFCTTGNPCAIDEGDCDSNSECEANLICDITISCLSYLGFTSDVNCCSNVTGCKFYFNTRQPFSLIAFSPILLNQKQIYIIQYKNKSLNQLINCFTIEYGQGRQTCIFDKNLFMIWHSNTVSEH